MNIENIQTFLSIVENNSFTKTADEMFCSQAAVSLRIKKLETYLGAKLFHRDKKKFELTNEGKLFIPSAEKIVDIIKDAQKNIFLSHNLQGAKINISSSSTPGTYIFPKILYQFRQKYPDVSLINQVQYTKDVIRDIEDNKYSIGFISQPDFANTENLICDTLMDDPLCLIVSVNHPWAKREYIHLHELKSGNLLVSNPKTSIIPYIEMLCQFTFQSENIHIIGNIEAIKQSVISNMGYSILSRYSIEKELKYGLIKEVKLADKTPLNRKIYCIRNKNFPLFLADEIFLDYAKDSINIMKNLD